MRINIVTGPFISYPPAAAGGIEKAWFSLGAEFVKCGHAVTIIGRAVEGRPQEEQIDGMHCIRALGSGRTSNIAGDLWRDLRYSVAIKRFIPAADVTIANTFFLPPLLAMSRRSRGRVVVHMGRFPKRQAALYRNVDLIHVPSNAVQDALLSQSPGFRNRVVCIPYPIDTTTYAPNGQAPDENLVIYVGRIHPEKGVHLAARAIAAMNGKRPALRLVGPVDVAKGGGGPAYLQQVRSEGPSVTIETLGEVADPKDLATELRRATVMCYPSLASRGETFGIAPLEAMAAGTPPVVSSLPVFTEHVIAGKTGKVFDHERSDAHLELAHALSEVISMPERRRELSQNGVAHARQFSVDKVAARLLTAFESLPIR